MAHTTRRWSRSVDHNAMLTTVLESVFSESRAQCRAGVFIHVLSRAMTIDHSSVPYTIQPGTAAAKALRCYDSLPSVATPCSKYTMCGTHTMLLWESQHLKQNDCTLQPASLHIPLSQVPEKVSLPLSVVVGVCCLGGYL